MIDFKKTLINLHEMFPEYDLGKLIDSPYTGSYIR